MAVATGDHDPLQVCVAAMVSAFVNDPFVVRRGVDGEFFGHIAYASLVKAG